MSTQNNNEKIHNQSGLIVFVSTIVISTLYFIYLVFIHPGVELNEVSDEQPDASGVVQKFDVTSVEKPWMIDKAVLKHGEKVYKQYCQACHGADFKAQTGVGARNLVEGAWRQGGDSISLYKTLTDGVKDARGNQTAMVGFAQLSPHDRWALVQVVKSVTKNRVEDDETALDTFGVESLKQQK